MGLTLSGLASGFDWNSLVDQLIEVERAPETRMRSEQTLIQQRNNAYGSIATELSVLQNKVQALQDSSLFDSRQTTSGDESIATATASSGAAAGTYSIQVDQLATASRQVGTANVGAALNSTNDVSGLVLSDAAFASAITAGNFTVNGKQITIATTDTLQDVFDQISTATSGAVTGSYDSTTDTISLSSASEIVLGSTTDTSNFLQAARLYNNGTGTVTSTSQLGTLKLSAALSSANLATAIDDGGGAGEFKINGVSITFDATESLATVINRINESEAGVTASYDRVNDRLTLSNSETGDVGVALEDVSGNFLAATGLSGGTLERGKNALYSINGGGQLVSQSNTITEVSSGLTGLSITAVSEGTTTVSVTSDSDTIKTAITDFISAYNSVQKLIDKQTASSTDSDGKVTAGLLANDREANEMASKLRGYVTSQVSGLDSVLDQLEDMGISSNGEDDTLEVSDSDKLDAALTNDLSRVKSLFSNSTNGLANTLNDYLDGLIGDNGSIETTQANLTKASADIDTQIADMERLIEDRRQQMVKSFVAMEEAQAKINQQLQYLTNSLSSG